MRMRCSVSLVAAALLLAACGEVPLRPDGSGDDGGVADAALDSSVPGCGNGVMEGTEQCDDGNAFTETCPYGVASCTVCSSTCELIAGVTAVCGDSVTNAPHENCDDGNAVTEACAYGQMSCSVCNATCQMAAGATAYCGNSAVNSPQENCDDGNAVTEACAYGQTSCTICNATCHSAAGATAYCGNNVVNSPQENCDDGNAVTETCAYGVASCTVCNSTCHSAAGATAYCGNAVVNSPQESCDDGNTVTEVCAYGLTSCTVCNSTCHAVAGSVSYCGDGNLDSNHEQCENANQCSGVAGLTCSGCECIRSGTTTMNSETGFDFSDSTSGSVTHGDFYYLFQANASKFWANNTGMQGLVDVGVVSTGLQSVTVPASGYSTQGVLGVVNHVYVAKAATAEPGWYIIFRVTAVSSTASTLTWIYVKRG